VTSISSAPGRADLCGSRPERWIPVARRLPHQAHGPFACRGRNAVAGRPARPAAQLGSPSAHGGPIEIERGVARTRRANAGRVAARFHLDPVGWFRSADDARLLPTIANAVWNEKCLDVRYRRAEGAVERQLQPLGLVLKAGVWYLVAQVGDQRAPIVSPTSSTSQCPRSRSNGRRISTDAVLVTSSRAFETSVYHSNATLRVTARGLAKLDVLGSPSPGRPPRRRRRRMPTAGSASRSRLSRSTGPRPV